MSETGHATRSHGDGERLSFATKLSRGRRACVLRLLVAAAILHVTLASLVFAVGRASVFPNVVDRNGVIAPLDPDSRAYQSESVKLAGKLKGAGFDAWAAGRADAHARLISLLLPLFGPNVLSAEPLNLAAYLFILFFVFKLGEEIGGGSRAGFVAACAVAVWPSFLLHTTQFLKDPFYIAAALALTFVVSTWLTRTYRLRAALVGGAAGGAAIGAITVVRGNAGTVVVVIVTLGIALLALRLLRGGRRLVWNLSSALLVLAFATVFLAHGFAKFRSTNPAQASQTGVAADGARGFEPQGDALQREAQGGALEQATPEPVGPRSDDLLSRLKASADSDAARVGHLRREFAHAYSDAGSTIDGDVEFGDTYDIIRYLPRAAVVGLFSPFPGMWFAGGRSVGAAGRLLGGGETLVMYFVELLALACLWRSRRRLPVWLLVLIAALGTTSLGLVVANAGALYRMRYVFWVLLIILGAAGLEGLLEKLKTREGRGEVAYEYSTEDA